MLHQQLKCIYSNLREYFAFKNQMILFVFLCKLRRQDSSCCPVALEVFAGTFYNTDKRGMKNFVHKPGSTDQQTGVYYYQWTIPLNISGKQNIHQGFTVIKNNNMREAQYLSKEK